RGPRRREHRQVVEEGRGRVRRVRPVLRSGRASAEGPAVRGPAEPRPPRPAEVDRHGGEDAPVVGARRRGGGPALHHERGRFPGRGVRGRTGGGGAPVRGRGRRGGRPALHHERGRFPGRVVRGRTGEGRHGHTVDHRRVV